MSYAFNNKGLKTISSLQESTAIEEVTHYNFGIDVINIIKEELPQIWDDYLIELITDNIQIAYQSELNLIDWFFEKGVPSHLTKEEVVNFLNRGILIPAKVTGENSLESNDLGTITGNFIKHYPKGSEVKLLLQPEDLEHDDKSNLKLEVVDRKFRGTNFIYTLKTESSKLIPVFVHSHHIHQHEIEENFGIKIPIYIDHLVCF